MTPDVDAIRRYACSGYCQQIYEQRGRHEPNCRGDEIRELCDEIERLRAEQSEADETCVWLGAQAQEFADWKNKAEAERDAALAECKRLRKDSLQVVSLQIARSYLLERNAQWRACAALLEDDLREALAECERLRNEKYLPAQLYKQITNDRDAWRACADQLAAALDSTDGMGKGIAAAYAEYVRLSA